MFLACIELADSDLRTKADRSRVLQLKFDHLETAKVWAKEESARRQDATGNAVVFEAMGPYLSLAWEHEAIHRESSTDSTNRLATPA